MKPQITPPSPPPPPPPSPSPPPPLPPPFQPPRRTLHDHRTHENPFGVIGPPIRSESSTGSFRDNFSSDDHQSVRPSSSSTNGFDPRVHLDYNSYMLVMELVSEQSQLPTTSSSSNNNLNNDPLSRVETLQELRKEICSLAKKQFGCKLLKSKLQTPTKDEIEVVLSEVLGSIAHLMKHQFGNQVIQKLISVCDHEQIALIVHELTEASLQIIDVCLSSYGAKAVQKLLENLKCQNQIIGVIKGLSRGVALLANDPNGHRVLQYCVMHLDSDFNQLIVDQIAYNCFKIATNKSGCCLMQACVEHSCGVARIRLVSAIMANAIQIAEDPFGNYVLQHMVRLKSPELTELLVWKLEGNFAHLSRNKYASNVVEKCLLESRHHISTKIILELVETPNPSSLLVDPYGNFVIQSALKVSKGFAYECLLKLISRNVASMQSNPYGKKILDRIEKRRIVHK